jgi:hypothetical protein
MKLDRNKNPNGKGKYALVLMRQVPPWTDNSPKALAIHNALHTLDRNGCLDFGNAGYRDFFVLRLRDVGAEAALRAYAEQFRTSDPEWAKEIDALATKAAARTDKKQPD